MTTANDLPRIKSITEAFSMQPITHTAGTKGLDKIVIESILVELGGPENYYVGYDSDGNKVFMYVTRSVNVDFF